MFKKGDKVVYGKTGVCVIEDICEKEILRNQKKLYYVLNPMFQQNNVIYAPTDSNKVFMRHIITRKQADELILQIPEIRKNIKSENAASEDYRTGLESHDCSGLIELTARIYEKKQIAKENKKKLGFSDEKYMRLAEELLFGELAAALEIPYDEVTNYIEKRLAY